MLEKDTLKVLKEDLESILNEIIEGARSSLRQFIKDKEGDVDFQGSNEEDLRSSSEDQLRKLGQWIDELRDIALKAM
jgi:hypothetical protein